MGAAQEVTLERGGRADSLGKDLPCGSTGGTLVWSGDMDAYGENYAAVRGSAYEFPAAGHT